MRRAGGKSMVFPFNNAVNVDRCPLAVRSRIVALKVLARGAQPKKGREEKAWALVH